MTVSTLVKPHIQIREVNPKSARDLKQLTKLHMKLLHFGPMTKLGSLFIQEIAYGVNLREGLLKAALYEIDGKPVGFISYTPRSITFHRTSLNKHWLYALWILSLSIVQQPQRFLRLIQVVHVMLSRRSEQEVERDPLGEVVSIGVLPDCLAPKFVRETGLRISQSLVFHAMGYFQRAGVKEMRMIVDADNKPALLFYHSLNATFTPAKQGQKSVVNVWFDLDNTPQNTTTIPSCWDLEVNFSDRPSVPADNWKTYWEGLTDSQRIFQVESADYVRRLSTEKLLNPEDHILDFGCGFGFVANQLAANVQQLSLWDASVNMRQRARLNVAGHQNIQFLQRSDLFESPPKNEFDLILVNSVVQYMTDAELNFWLATWRECLTSEGQLVLSDLIPDDYQSRWDMLDLLRFSLRHGFLFRVVQEGMKEIKRYRGMRHALPLKRFTREELIQRAADYGLSVRFTPQNLTYRQKRFTAVLSPARPTY
jgi:cyclopropane fatty-acyl-phospholipid synthase-like methyltransferase/ribosomal protein S18 acetylase RimI-like enzyme